MMTLGDVILVQRIRCALRLPMDLDELPCQLYALSSKPPALFALSLLLLFLSSPLIPARGDSCSLHWWHANRLLGLDQAPCHG